MAKRTLLDLIAGARKNERPIIFHENTLAALYAGTDLSIPTSHASTHNAGGADALSETGGGFITLVNGSGSGFNPADSTPFYIVQDAGAILSGSPSTTAPTIASITTPAMPVSITLVSIYLAIVCGTPGTTETGTGAIRIGNGVDTTVFNNSIQWNAVTNLFTVTGLSIAVSAGSFFSLKITPPVWATNPLATYYAAKIGFTRP